MIFACAQMVVNFASAYGNRPNVLDLNSAAAQDGPQRQFSTNQRCATACTRLHAEDFSL
jgi:hypothetical protein